MPAPAFGVSVPPPHDVSMVLEIRSQLAIVAVAAHRKYDPDALKCPGNFSSSKSWLIWPSPWAADHFESWR